MVGRALCIVGALVMVAAACMTERSAAPVTLNQAEVPSLEATVERLRAVAAERKKAADEARDWERVLAEEAFGSAETAPSPGELVLPPVAGREAGERGLGVELRALEAFIQRATEARDASLFRIDDLGQRILRRRRETSAPSP